MDLLRHWRRRTFGAAIAALIAPMAIFGAALAVGIGGGGLGGLASIDQFFGGPDQPRVEPSAARGPAQDAGDLIARINRRDRNRANRPAAAAPQAGAPAGGSAPSQGGGTQPQQSLGENDPAQPDPTIQTELRPVRPQPTVVQSPPAPQQPAPAPTTTPSLVRQVGDGVKQITDQVPVAGQPTGQVVDLLVDTVDGLSP